MRTPAAEIAFSSKETWRREPGVPWNAKTGRPRGLPASSQASSRPSGSSMTRVSGMGPTVTTPAAGRAGSGAECGLGEGVLARRVLRREGRQAEVDLVAQRIGRRLLRVPELRAGG